MAGFVAKFGKNKARVIKWLLGLRKRYYDELDIEITHLYSRLHEILRLSFPELEQLFSKWFTLFLKLAFQPITHEKLYDYEMASISS
ncbi:TPA: hypothetical protein QCY85_005607 [Bacillus cereus]|nr:hypothetical protein [Bacillus cereus]HDR8117960.1 hypothetical protein [Bacillus cereus]